MAVHCEIAVVPALITESIARSIYDAGDRFEHHVPIPALVFGVKLYTPNRFLIMLVSQYKAVIFTGQNVVLGWKIKNLIGVTGHGNDLVQTVE